MASGVRMILTLWFGLGYSSRDNKVHKLGNILEDFLMSKVRDYGKKEVSLIIKFST